MTAKEPSKKPKLRNQTDGGKKRQVKPGAADAEREMVSMMVKWAMRPIR